MTTMTTTMMMTTTRTMTRPQSIKSRLMTGVLLLVTITLLIAGATGYIVQRHALNDRLDDELIRSAQELQVLSDTGIAPNTLGPYDKSQDLIYRAMQRTMPALHQGMVGLHGKTITWTAPEVVVLRLESDQQLMDAVDDVASEEKITLRTISTDTTTYRAIIVPVKLAADTDYSSFIVAFDYSAEIAEINRNMLIFGAAGAIAMAIAAGASWFVVNRMLRPIRQLQHTAKLISDTDIARRVEIIGNDEFAQLTKTINEMLDRLETALSTQRQLLDDVGHELRTPTTIIIGHLQLMEPEDPEDVRSSREIALDELNRMSLLIEDLVTLAKSNRPDFIVPRRTPVGILLDEILDKARALGDRQFRINGRVEADVFLDPLRITQAMLQLCANSVKFSEPGTKITLDTRCVERHGHKFLRLSVTDEGCGIPAEDLPRIFERFGRGTNAVRTDGSGLGLNIVQAIAESHGGELHVVSRPEAGCEVFLEIPLRKSGAAV